MTSDIKTARKRSNAVSYFLGGLVLLLVAACFVPHHYFTTAGFMPHGHCYFWDPRVVWLHVLSDGFTALAYFTIPFTLIYFVRKRKDLAFDWIFICFAVFIVACGMTHVMEIVSVWRPYYWLSGTIKAITALASVPTAILLIRLMPQALAIPSQDQLREANESLQKENAERKAAETEVKRLNEELELRVQERTAELEEANERWRKLAIKHEQNERRQHEFSLLTQHLSATSSELEAARHLLNTCSKLFLCDAFSLDAYDPASKTVTAVLNADWVNDERQEVPPAYTKTSPSPLAKKVLNEGPQLILRAENENPAAGLSPFGDTKRHSASLMFVPIRSGENMLGILSVQSYAPHAYTQSDLDLLQFIADICGGALDRIRAGSALHLSERRYRTLVSASSAIVWTTDADGKIVQPLPLWQTYTGQTWEEYRGDGWIQSVHEEDRESLQQKWQAALQSRSIYQADARIFHATSQSWHWGTARGVPVLNEDGTVREWIGTVNDIDAEKRAQDEIRLINATLERRVTERTMELETTNKELESFCYSVSHDLRAPLRAIDGFSQALEEDYTEKLDDSGRGYLNRVRKATRRMGQLIDDLLELSRITRAHLQFSDVNLSQLARLVVDELQAGQPDRQVKVTIAPRLHAQCDNRLIRIALDNLIGNAWKFTRKKENAEIEVGMTIRDNLTVFFVRDNGAGFDMKYADKLFGAFQRLHTEAEYEGTGVGLANVQRVVHRHGGQIWAEAEIDKGATFYFTLPQADDEL